MQDAYPVCVFSGGRARSSVPGVRPSASDRVRYRVSGTRCRVAGTRYLEPGTWEWKAGTPADAPAHTSKNAPMGFASCILHLFKITFGVGKLGMGSGYPVPGTRWPESWSFLHHAYPVCGFFEGRRLIPGSRSRVPGTWDPGPGPGLTPRAEHRAPKTEPGHRKTRTPGMHPVSCIHILTEQ